MARPAERLLGSEQPRIFTPPLRELTPETSLGFAAAEFASDVCGVELFPWQRWLLIHALELLEDGNFRFRKVIVLVARQNGKSTLSQVLSLFFLYVLGTSLVLGTAQDLDTAEEVWDGALDIIEDTPELAELADKPIKVNGKKTIRLLSGERYKVKAANRRAGRGLSGDLVLLDELREHQSWDAWAAITGTTNARPNAQIWALSNAGDATSIVLRHLREAAHKALGDPDGVLAEKDPSRLLEDAPDEVVDDALEDDSLALFEWSAPAGADVMDREAWRWANPSLGHGSTTERTLRSAAITDPEWVFRTEAMCQWTDGTIEGPFPPGSWEAGIDPDSSIVGPVAACVDVSWDRGKAHIAFAGHRADGLPHVEIVASRAGTEWVAGWLAERVKKLDMIGVVVQGHSPAASLIDEFTERKFPMVEWSSGDVGRACGAFYDLVRADPETDEPCGELRHLAQPVLDVAAATAVSRPVGDAWAWDRKKSPVDCSPLVAATGAVWLLGKPVDKPVRSIYDDMDTDLIVV